MSGSKGNRRGVPRCRWRVEEERQGGIRDVGGRGGEARVWVVGSGRCGEGCGPAGNSCL